MKNTKYPYTKPGSSPEEYIKNILEANPSKIFTLRETSSSLVLEEGDTDADGAAPEVSEAVSTEAASAEAATPTGKRWSFRIEQADPLPATLLSFVKKFQKYVFERFQTEEIAANVREFADKGNDYIKTINPHAATEGEEWDSSDCVEIDLKQAYFQSAQALGILEPEFVENLRAQVLKNHTEGEWKKLRLILLGSLAKRQTVTTIRPNPKRAEFDALPAIIKKGIKQAPQSQLARELAGGEAWELESHTWGAARRERVFDKIQKFVSWKRCSPPQKYKLRGSEPIEWGSPNGTWVGDRDSQAHRLGTPQPQTFNLAQILECEKLKVRTKGRQLGRDLAKNATSYHAPNGEGYLVKAPEIFFAAAGHTAQIIENAMAEAEAVAPNSLYMRWVDAVFCKASAVPTLVKNFQEAGFPIKIIKHKNIKRTPEAYLVSLAEPEQTAEGERTEKIFYLPRRAESFSYAFGAQLQTLPPQAREELLERCKAAERQANRAELGQLSRALSEFATRNKIKPTSGAALSRQMREALGAAPAHYSTALVWAAVIWDFLRLDSLPAALSAPPLFEAIAGATREQVSHIVEKNFIEFWNYDAEGHATEDELSETWAALRAAVAPLTWEAALEDAAQLANLPKYRGYVEGAEELPYFLAAAAFGLGFIKSLPSQSAKNKNYNPWE